MLHVVTVHFRSDRWVEPQLRYLRRFAPPETQVWASLDGIAHRRGFEHETTLEGTHAEKLQELARMVSCEARPDDHLLFLDSDAFPVAPLAPLLVADEPLVALRRRTPPKPVPHACFCLTTVGLWNDVGGDWGKGAYGWTNSAGRPTTDVGANLMVQLEERGVKWRALHRLNTRELDSPRRYTIIGDEGFGPVAYHHGAGSHTPRPKRKTDSWIPSGVPVVSRLERSIRHRVATRRHTMGSSHDVFGMIQRDEDLVAFFVA